jgi:hypothetical protein
MGLGCRFALVLAVWVCVAESQDGVEPLTLLEIDPSEATTQQVLANMQFQSQQQDEKTAELRTEAAVRKAEDDTVAAAGDAQITEEEDDSSDEVDETSLKPVVKKGLEALDKATDENTKLRQQLLEARSKAASLEQTQFKTELQKAVLETKEKFQAKRDANPVADTYTAIPFFMYKVLAKQVEANSVEGCQAVCSAQNKCKSFTWDKRTKNCWWSVEKLTYDDDYDYSAKQQDEKGTHWAETPGLRWTTPISKNLYKVSKEQCRDACLKEGAACNAISFKKSTSTCIRSSEALPTSQHATYFEKNKDKYDKAETAAIEAAKRKLESKFKVKETAEKASQKEEQEKITREAAAKKATRENYVKQSPAPAEELKIKKKVGLQVQAEKVSLEASMVKKEEREELKRSKNAEDTQQATLALLEKMQAKEQKYESDLKSAKQALKKNKGLLEKAENDAQNSADRLDNDLGDVSDAHKRAMEAMLAWKDLKDNPHASPAVKDQARLTLQSRHRDLSVGIHEAELSHTKEVESKKVVESGIRAEKKAAAALNSAEERVASQRKKDQEAVAAARKRAKTAAMADAKYKLSMASTSFEALKAKESMEKKAQAGAAAQVAMVEHQLKNGPSNQSLEDQMTNAKESNEKAKASLHELNTKFRDNLEAVMTAKATLAALQSKDDTVTKKGASVNSKIAEIEESISNTGGSVA